MLVRHHELKDVQCRCFAISTQRVYLFNAFRRLGGRHSSAVRVFRKHEDKTECCHNSSTRLRMGLAGIQQSASQAGNRNLSQPRSPRGNNRYCGVLGRAGKRKRGLVESSLRRRRNRTTALPVRSLFCTVHAMEVLVGARDNNHQLSYQ